MWVWLDADNAGRLVTALGDFGFGSLGLSPADFTDPDVVVQLGHAPKRCRGVARLARSGARRPSGFRYGGRGQAIGSPRSLTTAPAGVLRTASWVHLPTRTRCQRRVTKY